MARYRLMHCATGTVLPGYVLMEATPEEVSAGNHRLKQVGCQHRYVIDMHAPALEELVQSSPTACNQEKSPTET